MPDPAFGILCGDGVEGWFELCFQSFESTWRFGLEPLFHLGPGALDRGERGRVPRQVQKPEPSLLKRPEHAHADQENRAGAWLASCAIALPTHRRPHWIHAQIKSALIN
jgi:hypothetical protein